MKKIISLLLCISMVLALSTGFALADNDELIIGMLWGNSTSNSSIATMNACEAVADAIDAKFIVEHYPTFSP